MKEKEKKKAENVWLINKEKLAVIITEFGELVRKYKLCDEEVTLVTGILRKISDISDTKKTEDFIKEQILKMKLKRISYAG